MNGDDFCDVQSRITLCSCMKRRRTVLVTVCLMVGVLRAAEGLVGALGPSVYADTEVSTNVPFNVRRSDLKGLDVDFTFHATASNCLQVAVGRDDDGDGVLSMSETGVLFGWRGGAFVVENVPDQARLVHVPGGTNAVRTFSFHLWNDDAYRPKRLAVRVDTADVFPELTESVPEWLYRPDWNLMRVTRRGGDPCDEWIACAVRHRVFHVILR